MMKNFTQYNLSMIITISALFLQLTACVSKTNRPEPRAPASLQEALQSIPELRRDFTLNFSQSSCHALIQKYADTVYNSPSGFYFPQNQQEKKLLLESSREVIQNIFELRLLIQERFKSFPNPSTECIDAVRKAFRYTRFAEDAVAEWLEAQNGQERKFNRIFGYAWPYTIARDTNFTIQPGDLLLMRGKTFISATIARVGDADSQFSHLGIVGVDAKGEKYLIESIVEKGTILHKLDKFLETQEARLVVYRYADPVVAKKAGELIYQKASAALKTGGIPYDFRMDPIDHNEIFCSELVQYAYELATDGKVVIPKYKSSYAQMHGSALLKVLNMDVVETFAPADIEFDPRFQLVAEWKFIPDIRKTKVQDAIFTAVFDWIVNKKYELQPELTSWSAGRLAHFIRQQGLFADKMQKHMKPALLSTVVQMQYMSLPIEKHMLALENAYYQKMQHSMNFKDLLAEVERYRKADCLRHQNSLSFAGQSSENKEASDFHWIFRSNNKSCN